MYRAPVVVTTPRLRALLSPPVLVATLFLACNLGIVIASAVVVYPRRAGLPSVAVWVAAIVAGLSLLVAVRIVVRIVSVYRAFRAAHLVVDEVGIRGGGVSVSWERVQAVLLGVEADSHPRMAVVEITPKSMVHRPQIVVSKAGAATARGGGVHVITFPECAQPELVDIAQAIRDVAPGVKVTYIPF